MLSKHGIIFTEQELWLSRLDVPTGRIKVSGSSERYQLYNQALCLLTTHFASTTPSSVRCVLEESAAKTDKAVIGELKK